MNIPIPETCGFSISQKKYLSPIDFFCGLLYNIKQNWDNVGRVLC